jgi:hypothetical protein
MTVAYVEAGDGAGRVARHQLHLDAELAVQVPLLREEPGAGVLVQEERRHLLARRVVPDSDHTFLGELPLVEPLPRRGGALEREDGDHSEQQSPRPPHHCACLCGSATSKK